MYIIEIQFAVFAVCVALSAVFSAAETALINIRRSRLQALAEEGAPAALLIQRALDHPERALASIQAVNTTLAMLGVVAAVLLLAPEFGGIDTFHGVAASTACAWLVMLLFGEIIPKTVARRRSERVAMVLIRPVMAMAYVIFPVVLILVRIANVLIRCVPGLKPLERNPYITEEEIKVLVEKGEEMGDLEEDEREMVTAIFELDRRVVREVMVPRVDVVSMDAGAPLDEVLDTLIARGFTRLPVYEGSLDNVVGVLHAKDLLRYLRHGRQGFTLRAVMRPAYFVPENKNAKTLLEEMRSRRIPIAAVVDEYGGTAGIVTLEDLVEEIVGEIRDEYDVEEDAITRLGDDVALVDGKTPIQDVNDELDIEITTEEYDSVGGFVVGLFGYPPKSGEECAWENIRFVVERAKGNRVLSVRVLVDRGGEKDE
ncbi:MAG TPA: hemolysin family protein [Armatimonadota bacterium]|jgi:CBS domain containing-hemolysin-like protein